jgi:voltage-gated potassium channel
VQAAVALFAGVIFVASTYYRDDASTETAFSVCELVIGLLFAIDYVYHINRAQDRVRFFFKPRNLYDVCTIIPSILWIIPPWRTPFGDLLKSFVGVWRILRVFRLLRLYKLSKEANEESFLLREYWETRRKSFVVLTTLVLSLCVAAGLLNQLSHLDIGFALAQQPLTFDEALYFITVTSATVGYGDYYPQNSFSQFVVLLFIVFMIFIVAKTTSNFNDLHYGASEYKLPFGGHKKKHLLLLGAVTPDTLLKFAKEFYHPENVRQNDTPILVMLPEEPPDDFKFLLKSPFFENKVFYLAGNPLLAADLKLAKLSDNSVVILSNQYTKEPHKSDTFGVLATQLLKELYPRTRIYTQLALAQNAEWTTWIGWERVVPVQQLKMGLLA